jgi:hypothetical protein
MGLGHRLGAVPRSRLGPLSPRAYQPNSTPSTVGYVSLERISIARFVSNISPGKGAILLAYSSFFEGSFSAGGARASCARRPAARNVARLGTRCEEAHGLDRAARRRRGSPAARRGPRGSALRLVAGRPRRRPPQGRGTRARLACRRLGRWSFACRSNAAMHRRFTAPRRAKDRAVEADRPPEPMDGALS